MWRTHALKCIARQRHRRRWKLPAISHQQRRCRCPCPSRQAVRAQWKYKWSPARHLMRQSAGYRRLRLLAALVKLHTAKWTLRMGMRPH